jgi:site-specific recombinase XerD
MRDAIKAAGLPLEAQPHGLRKAAGRRMAEAGASANMIMSVLGHVTMSEAQKYCDEADQAALAEQALSKLEAHKRNENSQTRRESLGKQAKKKGKSK